MKHQHPRSSWRIYRLGSAPLLVFPWIRGMGLQLHVSQREVPYLRYALRLRSMADYSIDAGRFQINMERVQCERA